MNIKEAIENIKDCVRYSIKQHNWREEEDAYDEESLTIAVSAMKKQIPMKPVIEQGAPSYYGGAGICRDYCGCPKCGEEVGRGDDKANYCPDCGQKLDWEEE